MLRFVYWVYMILFLLIPISITCALGNDKTVDSSFVVQVKDELLTVRAMDIPLEKVLMEVAIQKSIKFTSYASVEEPIEADFSRLPMAEGLKKMLHDYNYTFINGTEKTKDGRHEIIRKVIILSKAEESRYRKVEPKVFSTKEPSLKFLSEDPDIRKDMPDSLDEAEPTMASWVDALEESDDVRNTKLLTWILLNDKDEGVRMSVADELGKVGSEIAIDSLQEALLDEKAMVRETAVNSLGEIGGVRAVEALEVALSDESEDMRELAAEELREIQERARAVEELKWLQE